MEERKEGMVEGVKRDKGKGRGEIKRKIDGKSENGFLEKGVRWEE